MLEVPQAVVSPMPMNALWSYAYARRAKVAEAIDSWPVDTVRFFADSGAHSARTLGIHLDCDTYGGWLTQHHDALTIYCNLDVIWGPASTWRNQQTLEGMGLSPMPVFHTGEPWSWLERYLEAGYTYIALGKLLGNPWKKLRPWLQRAFAIAGDTAVFHGFGLTSWPAIREFPFYSVDSSSWTGPYRFQQVLRLFDPDTGRWYSVKLRERDSVREHLGILRRFQVPVSTMKTSAGGYDRHVLAMASAKSYALAGEWIAKQHGPITLPPGKGYPTGTPVHHKVARADQAGRFHLYLAETTVWAHEDHAKALARPTPERTR